MRIPSVVHCARSVTPNSLSTAADLCGSRELCSFLLQAFRLTPSDTLDVRFGYVVALEQHIQRRTEAKGTLPFWLTLSTPFGYISTVGCEQRALLALRRAKLDAQRWRKLGAPKISLPPPSRNSPRENSYAIPRRRPVPLQERSSSRSEVEGDQPGCINPEAAALEARGIEPALVTGSHTPFRSAFPPVNLATIPCCRGEAHFATSPGIRENQQPVLATAGPRAG